MCALCIEHKKVFPSEQIVYSKSDYETHLRKGGKEGFEGHPQCEFCRKRYYDKDMLFGHLHKDHYSCHICERAGIRYKYYKDYSSLEAHFRKDHILCEESECLAKKFVVFSDSIDYAAHNLAFHPNIRVCLLFPGLLYALLTLFFVSRLVGISRCISKALGMGARATLREIEGLDAAKEDEAIVAGRHWKVVWEGARWAANGKWNFPMRQETPEMF